MRNRVSGMTLIEVLVAGMIALVLTGIMLIIIATFDEQMDENNAYYCMQLQYENIAEQIGFNARKASKILEASSVWHDSCAASPDTVSAVKLWNSQKTVFAGYRLTGDTLQEFDTTSGIWKSYETGGYTVRVKNGGYFILNGCRSSIALDISLKSLSKDTCYYLKARKDEFLCRN